MFPLLEEALFVADGFVEMVFGFFAEHNAHSVFDFFNRELGFRRGFGGG